MGIFRGIGYALNGFSIIGNAKVRAFVLVPLLFNVLLFGIAIWVASTYFADLIAWLLGEAPSWLISWLPSWLIDAITWLIRATLWLALVIVTFFSFAMVGNLIAAPFNSLLAERVEQLLTGQPVETDGSLAHVLKAVGPTIASELRKILYFVLRAIPLGILFLIPGLQVVAPLLWFLFLAWMFVIEYGDYPMGNHEMLFSEQQRYFKQSRSVGLGFGVVVSTMLMIPVLNFFAMPVAVAGATKMWVTEWREQALAARQS